MLRSAIDALTLLIAPFAPHFAEELWEALGNKGSIANAAWPQYDPEAIVATEMTVVVQVNGKVRSKLTLPAGTPGQGHRGRGARGPEGQGVHERQTAEEGDRGPGEARECGGVKAGRANSDRTGSCKCFDTEKSIQKLWKDERPVLFAGHYRLITAHNS